MKQQYILIFLLVIVITSGPIYASDFKLSDKAQLGKRLFFDPRLSEPAGQSCASCHSPSHGFTDPRGGPVSEGVIKGRFTSRSTPSVSYAGFAPALHWDAKEEVYVGGFFHDGRANSLEEQGVGPILGALEMANKSKTAVVARLQKTEYLAAFIKIYGANALSDTETGFAQLVELIASYERSVEVNSFSSKYDLYLEKKIELTAAELRGLKVFDAEDKGNCAACHPSSLGEQGEKPLFTDFTYDNLGVPGNPENPFLGLNKKFNPDGKHFRDKGLGGFLKDKDQDGKFKVPTLRNIALTAPYMHNGVFSTLKEVVDFYNTRDVDKKWDKPEIEQNVNTEELGDLKLTDQEVDDLVAFLKVLTDGYQLNQ